jgi:hypothetical protein
VAAGLAAADEDAVPVIVADAGQAAEVRGVRIDGEAPGDDSDAAPAFSSVVHAGKFIGNPAATLPETHNHEFHDSPHVPSRLSYFYHSRASMSIEVRSHGTPYFSTMPAVF